MKKFLGTIVQVAATAGATLVNPALGIVVGGAFAGGEGGKRLGKKLAATGARGHKITGPVGALALPAILGPIAGAAGVDMAGLCATVQSAVATVCENPALAGGAVSALMVLLHGATRNTTRGSA